jgi:hypothetical protein
MRFLTFVMLSLMELRRGMPLAMLLATVFMWLGTLGT